MKPPQACCSPPSLWSGFACPSPWSMECADGLRFNAVLLVQGSRARYEELGFEEDAAPARKAIQRLTGIDSIAACGPLAG